jgi:glycosyltransferase involved in cell wall biosynthesis
MSLTILNVAYPLAPVSADAVGGAEQIIHMLDRGLVDRGYRSLVIACQGSRVAGELVCTAAPSQKFDTRVHAEVAAGHRRVLEMVLARTSVDVVHLHGHDVDMYLPPEGPTVLATLHLPPELLIAHLTEIQRLRTWAHGVSRAQHARLPRVSCLLPPIENGIDIDKLPRATRRGGFAVLLGRICPEKGVHFALEAARLARVPIFVGGAPFPYEEHRRYFEHEVLPRLGRDRRFIGPVSTARKRRLLSAARCVLVPSTAEETSSLVAMEALACGAPVIAFARGALPDIVQHGVTGFVVRSVDEMADAIHRVGEIDSNTCREVARARFSARRMVAQYIERYEEILSWPRVSRFIHPTSLPSA